MQSVALTFDDGPDPVWTGCLLDLLSDIGARATFFPIAGRAAECPRLIERMLSEGHSVGLHCLEHVRHTDRDESWLKRDTEAGLAILTDLGVEPVFWRPPWGVAAPWTVQVARDHGLSLVGWTVDTHDWRGDRADSMLQATRSFIQNGSVVLAHDAIGPGARRGSSAETLRYVLLVARLAKRRGLELDALAHGALA